MQLWKMCLSINLCYIGLRILNSDKSIFTGKKQVNMLFLHFNIIVFYSILKCFWVYQYESFVEIE